MMRLLVIALVCACNPVPSSFQCTGSEQCRLDDGQGVCEPNGFCSLADTDCLSGRRYVGAGDLDGTCVDTASLCPRFTGIACESFESATVDSPWQVYVPNAMFERSTDRFARGDASGRFEMLASGALGRTYGEIGASALPSTATIAARAFYFFPSAPPYAHSRLIALRQTESLYHHIEVGFNDNKLSTFNSITMSYRSVTLDVPTDRWFCVELVVGLGAAGTVRAYLDGTELEALRLDETTEATPAFSGMFFGLAVDDPGAATPAYDYWIDEVAVDAARVGCDR